MHEALYYTPHDKDSRVKCHLCPHNCIIAKDATGICRQRKNINGELYTLNYGKVSSVNMDPIEKKPLYHFLPGTDILSIGTNGCNLACMFCQNWNISQEDSNTTDILPEEIIDMAREHKSAGIAYTYNEPLIWYEFVLETAKLARANGLKNVMVTNGFINPEPLAELLPYIDALDIDLKSTEPDFYRRLCKGKLEPVLETCKAARSVRTLVEITNLVIPQENDSEENFQDIAQWIAENLGKDTPLHFSAYYPAYKLSRPATPLSTLLRAYHIARQHLRFVYLGNVHSKEGNDTFCQKCNTRLIQRMGLSARVIGLTKEGKCSRCGAENNIVI